MNKPLAAIVLGLGIAYSTPSVADQCKQYPTLQGQRIAVITEGRTAFSDASSSLIIYGTLTRETCGSLYLKNTKNGSPFGPYKRVRKLPLTIIHKKRIIGIQQLPPEKK